MRFPGCRILKREPAQSRGSVDLRPDPNDAAGVEQPAGLFHARGLFAGRAPGSACARFRPRRRGGSSSSSNMSLTWLDLFKAFALGMVEGLTAFVPVSAS